MKLQTEPYLLQKSRWPQTGNHILAQFDDSSIIVYQAYRPDIGIFAANHGYFGGDFRLSRMSWIKPNFLWIMYRNGWGTKPNQEVTLAIRLKRPFFESILRQAVHTHFVPARYPDNASWQSALHQSDVRLQWDPDHGPKGNPTIRRAIQLGLSGTTLAAYAKEQILEIQNISDFVADQRQHLTGTYENLLTPREEIYLPSDKTVVTKLELSANIT